MKRALAKISIVHPMKKLFTKNFIPLFLLPTVLLSCGFSTSSWELSKAEKAEKNEEYQLAIQYYYKHLRKTSDTQESIYPAQKIFQLSSLHLIDTDLIEKSLKHIIIRSDDQNIRMDAQFKLANHYFDQINDYESAISNFNKFLALSNKHAEKNIARLKIAKSYFYLNNFYQSQVEIDDILKSEPEEDLKFDAKLLLASVLQSEKKYPKAVQQYEELLKEFPVRSEKDQIYMNLSLALEDNKDFGRAIDILKKYKQKHKKPAYIEEKIKKIQFLMSQQPGARGRVK